jgi:hypothetical protein
MYALLKYGMTLQDMLKDVTTGTGKINLQV